jgi:hypothetical protein
VATLVIKTARELIERESLVRQASRRAARQTALVQDILRRFVHRGGPIPVEHLVAPADGKSATEIYAALTRLDDEDLIRIRGGYIDIAYPFSASPTAFVVRLPNGQKRYACCAMDALGIAPMLDQPIHIRSRCHDCEMQLEFSVLPREPGPDAAGVMMWFGARGDERRKVADSL